jgi:hypothetical protein
MKARVPGARPRDRAASGIEFHEFGDPAAQRRVGAIYPGIQVPDPHACAGEAPLPAGLEVELL